jgi:hypothetical protein
MSNEEPWMSETVHVALERADVDMLELLMDGTAYPDAMRWVDPMIDSLKEDAQFPHRVNGFFERVFNACIEAVKEDK